jgi:hypothetical protein
VVAQRCGRRSPVRGRPARGIWSEGAVRPGPRPPVGPCQRAWAERRSLGVGVVVGQSGGSVRWSRRAEANAGPDDVSFTEGDHA